MAQLEYTPQELMVVVAARQIKDGARVFVGMRLPLLAFALAKLTHAPNAVGLFENGLLRDRPAPELLYTMSDGPNVQGAGWATRMGNVLGLLQQGAIDLGFIGGAEVDRFGNLNTSYVSGPDGRKTRLPGSGGACDIATGAGRFVIIMEHEPRRFRPAVTYRTSPGFGDGTPGWRQRQGLPGKGPLAVITTMALLDFDLNPAAESREMRLASYHPFTTPQAIAEATGWPLKLSPDLVQTPPPTDEELQIIRQCDPKGFWTR
ncbi:MAG TPA: CoA-transferase [Chloroflexia bacterium]|nr:CoA-transferase [Chloroflexia bacterium]